MVVFLAQIGCFVPAQRMTLAPVEHIYVINHSPETVAASLSQFAIELSQVSLLIFN